MANRRPLVSFGGRTKELPAADGLRVGNISLFDGGGGSAVTAELPKIGGLLLSWDPTGTRLTLGNDTTDVPAALVHFRDNAELVSSNDTNAAVGTVASGKLSLAVATSFIGSTRLGYFVAESNAFGDNGTIYLYGKAGGSEIPLWRAIADNLRAQTFSLGAADGTGFAGTFVPDVTANRNYTTPDRAGMMALDDEQFIIGLSVSTGQTGNTITVGEGSAYIESEGRVVNYAGGTITGNPSASTHYYVYLLANGTIEKSTTAPASPYAGTARSKTSATDRRFLGAVRSLASGTAWIPQYSSPTGNECYVTFTHNSPADSSLLAGGTSTTTVDVPSSATFAPPIAVELALRVQNTGTAGNNVRYYAWTGAAHTLWGNCIPSASQIINVPCDTTPKIRYDVLAGGIAGFVMLGYTYRR